MSNEVQQLSVKCLAVLNDERVMLPSNSTEAMADLKNILRRLIAGQLLLTDAPPPAVVPESEDDPE